MKKNKIYIKSVRKANAMKFSTGENGTKTFFDKEFGTTSAYGSGQQVKRCFIEYILNELGIEESTIEFLWKKEGKEDIVRTSGNPKDIDQLFGGWMRTDNGTKRTSPFSISYLKPLHPLLCSVFKDQGTFDRRESKNAKVMIADLTKDGEAVNIENVLEELDKNTIHKFKANKFLNPEKIINGIYYYEMEIDLKRLFSINISKLNPEVLEETIAELENLGWTYNADETKMVLPRQKIDELIPVIADAIIHWSLGSNKTRTYESFNTFAIAISDKAYELPLAIGAEIYGDENNLKAKMVLDNSKNNLYTSKEVNQHIVGAYNEKFDIEDAKLLIIKKLSEYDYHEQ